MHCPDPGSNRGPLDLQSNALPTELSRHCIDVPILPANARENQNKYAIMNFLVFITACNYFIILGRIKITVCGQ